MDPQDERDLATPVICPNCGAPNVSDDVRCRTCGAWLGEQGQVIDVTTGEPQPVEEPQEYPGGWQGRIPSMTFEHGRVTVVRGGNRGCLVLSAIVALVSCCVCWVLLNGVGAIV